MMLGGQIPCLYKKQHALLRQDDYYIVILLEKSILNGIGKGCKEMEDGGKFSLGVSPKFFDGI
ncbi:MAG: hypothetical protein LBR91_00965, partial [Puniceicoccales bacterium]|nr:hypothetical protein [Puniceicoccales bacterium]